MSSSDDRPSPGEAAEVGLQGVADLNLQDEVLSSTAGETVAPSSPPVPAEIPHVVNNVPGFRYKYPQAKPTPPGVDDTEWNKLFTAADSRFYNKHGKNSKESEKYRIRGETYTLALKMLDEKREKARLVALGVMPAKARKIPTAKKAEPSIKREKEPAFWRDPSPPTGDLSTSIAEKIKSEGRARKVPSVAASSDRGTPGPTTAKASTPILPPPPKIVKKKAPGSAKIPAPKSSMVGAANNPAMVKHITPSTKTAANSSDSESNDGGEYCLCRGPDDHRMMVCCEGGCDDWYHCSCVGIDETDTKELLDRFVCPNCTTETTFTTWKPMCRYFNVGNFLGTVACRKAARVTMEVPSKYCSDEHRDAFWTFVKSRVRDDDKPSMGGALNQGEVGWILQQCKTATELHQLGGKPRLPKQEGADPNRPVGLDYITPEEQLEIEEIQAKKAVFQKRIESYTNQITLLKLVIKRAEKAREQPNLEFKDPCGYDSRLAMNETEFAAWSLTAEGLAVLQATELGPRTGEPKTIIPFPGQVLPPEKTNVPDALRNVCLKNRKKCKHINWKELHHHEFVYNRKILMDELERLERAEAEIVNDAETREATKDYYANNVTEQLF